MVIYWWFRDWIIVINVMLLTASLKTERLDEYFRVRGSEFQRRIVALWRVEKVDMLVRVGEIPDY